MIQRRRFFWLSLLAIPLLLGSVAPLEAQDDNLDVVLAIDNSGSMQGNDPRGLRWSAAQLFVDLADAGDRVAALAFSDGVQSLGDAATGQMTLLDDAASRRAVKETLAPRFPDGATNMADAMETALELLESSGGNRPVIVFLTDGRPEPPEQRGRLLELIAEAGERNITVFPILLGTGTDESIAAQMVQETGGLQQNVLDASGLLRAFGQIYTYIRPERYTDQLSLASYGASFGTNPDQAITDVAVVVPRSTENEAITSLRFAGEDLTEAAATAGGARVGQADAPHYELITVSGNVPLSGQWDLDVSSAAGETALLVATSGITMDVLHPVPLVRRSFVAPRLVHPDEPVLLVARTLQNDAEVGDVPLAVVTEGEQVIPLQESGLSANQTLAWEFLDLSLADGTRKRIEIQIGDELSPFRLRKELVVAADAGLPRLVIDSPGGNTAVGLGASGNLRIAAHFEGQVANPSVQAFIRDQTDDRVTEVTLQCGGNGCVDESFDPEPGRTYQIVLAATATYGGVPFSASGETMLATGDVIQINGLNALSSMGPLAPGEPLPEIELTVIAFLRSGQPQLGVDVTSIRPQPAGVSPDRLDAVLAPLTLTSNNSYSTELILSGFDQLPPDDYTVSLRFTTSNQEVTLGPEIVEFQYRSLPATVHLRTEIPLEFGRVVNLTQPRVVNIPVRYANTAPFELTASVVALESSMGQEDPAQIEVDVGQPFSAEEGDEVLVPLRLSALRSLHPGDYRGQLLFGAASGGGVEIEPDQAPFVFTIPQPLLRLADITPPDELVGCPELDGEDELQDGALSFGAIRAHDQPQQVLLTFDAVTIQERPEIRVSLTGVTRRGDDEGGSFRNFTLRPGQPQELADGGYLLPLELDVPAGAPDGDYAAVIELSSPGAEVEPAKVDTRFYVRTGFFGRLRQSARPVTCTALDWYTILPFPRWKGLVGWGMTLLAFVILVNTSTPTRGTMSSSTGEEVRFTSDQSAYVVREGRAFRLTTDAERAPEAVAQVTLSDEEEGPVARVWPGQRRRGAQVSVLHPNGRWSTVRAAGKEVPDGGSLSVRTVRGRRRGPRHIFSVSYE